MGSSGTRERIIEQNRYRPSKPRAALRPRMYDSPAGISFTVKRPGDLIIDEFSTIEVTRNGHEYRRTK